MLCIFFSVNSICSLNLVLTPCAQVFSIEYGDMQALVLYVNNPKDREPTFSWDMALLNFSECEKAYSWNE